MIEKHGPNGQKIKPQILGIIKEIIHKSQWNQIAAAKVLGVDQPKVSQIINGKAAGFSLERLLVFLLRLQCKIELSVSMNKTGLTNMDEQVADNLDAINLIVLSKDDY
ncbi:helix-turn-helix domain-containing protein [Anaplasma capra]|uniref:helix-turn-helix domain-containing protein n=1 Tax=Anaplasma capra TaxID=1562740 RepID=UPI0021D5E624|nr:helix-turn-helix domain-containing protein [Anaplasma capra]MCU7611448.1 helix-turn-helix domain-containing protein [Anaplasma capra]MCU7612113.1 helix-turn-helix domain-containing protein [Anaplasma capra]